MPKYYITENGVIEAQALPEGEALDLDDNLLQAICGTWPSKAGTSKAQMMEELEYDRSWSEEFDNILSQLERRGLITTKSREAYGALRDG